MRREDRHESDYMSLYKQGRQLKGRTSENALRIAILADAATQQLATLLRAIFASHGVETQIYEGHFDAIELEVFHEGSEFYQFQPRVVLVLNTGQSMRLRYYARPAGEGSFAERELERIERVWDQIQARLPATIVQSNVVVPLERSFGHFDAKMPGTLYGAVTRINAGIAERSAARPNVLLCDTESVAAYVGKRHWFDERLWTLSKTPCALEHLPLLAHALADVVLPTLGRVVKCVVLDLDNTLWGGVIGDDGLEGIQVGPFGEGESFLRFQHYLRELKRRGIVLAVCSKNDLETARRPFREHPEMVLREEDISVFVANWENKADNIRSIQQVLNIGLDSMVFLDDNPFERNLVRERLPEVIVPDLPEDPADYLRKLYECNLFETSTFSPEDAQRPELYRQEVAQQSLRAEYSSIEDYLKSLEMEITVARFDRFHLPRIAQLMQRSNQFNLTTRRLSETECAQLMHDPDALPLYVKLKDRFADHGLISVVIAREEAGELRITDWLMSCRVLSRGVEQCAMNHLVAEACRRGLTRITAEYRPTAKNGMVREFYAQFGFRKTAEDPSGASAWQLETAEYTPATVHMRESVGETTAAVS